MKQHTKDYFNFFHLSPIDIVWDEWEWVVNERLVVAVDIHHIAHGANKVEHISNYMALTREHHINDAHGEKSGFDRKTLKKLHIDFVNTNPYGVKVSWLDLKY